jgi:hypothetical protein
MKLLAVIRYGLPGSLTTPAASTMISVEPFLVSVTLLMRALQALAPSQKYLNPADGSMNRVGTLHKRFLLE